MQSKNDSLLYRWGGIAALVAAVVFLFTLVYVFGFLFSLGLTEVMLDTPAALLPWVAAHAGSYTGLYWIFLASVVALLPVPLAPKSIARSPWRQNVSNNISGTAALLTAPRYSFSGVMVGRSETFSVVIVGVASNMMVVCKSVDFSIH